MSRRAVVLVAMLAAATPLRPAVATPPRTRAPVAVMPGDRVLCLYDSSEGVSASKNPLSGEVARILGRLGLEVSFRDVARGLPAPEDVAGLRAVVTGFSDGIMPAARRGPRSCARPRRRVSAWS